MKRACVALCALLAGGAVVGCGYEGRSLDLFPERADPAAAARCGGPGDCPDNRPLCTAGLCVECLSDADCRAGRPACVRGVCVTCSGPEHCPEGSTCNVAAERCAPSCEQTGDCGGATASCDLARGFCVECAESAECTRPDRPVCEPEAGRCVECIEDVECLDPARPACAPARNRCEACNRDEHCPGSSCELARGACRPAP